MDRSSLASVHVALDALALGPQPAGVGRYVSVLLKGLGELEGAPSLTVVARAKERSRLDGTRTAGPGPLASRPALRPLWEQAALPLLTRIRRFDLIHGLMGVVPVAARVPKVVTIHDATFYTHPEHHTPVKLAYFRAALPLMARAARAVVTDSAASREEVVRALRLPPERVHVVPLAVDPLFTPAGPGEVAEARARYRLRGPFVLYAGVLEPRKNLPRLIAAVGGLRRRGYPHRLVLAGKAGWRFGPIRAAIEAGRGWVDWLGFVPDRDLRRLLAACDVFAYLPLAEGFGLPVAEALACGVPVVTSNRSSLPEVAGGAALLAEPLDPAAIEAALARVLDDARLRADLARLGLARAASLTPRALAEGTVAVYRAVLG